MAVDKARILSHNCGLSFNQESDGLALSVLASRAEPAFKKTPISAEVILLAVGKVCIILKHIIRMKVTLSFSKSPLLTL